MRRVRKVASARVPAKPPAGSELESLGLLAGGIAHDLNNILTVILGNATLARELAGAGESVLPAIDHVVCAAERAALLTKRLLAHARKREVRLVRVDLSEQVAEIAALLAVAIPKHVRLRMELAPDLPPVEADPSQLQQVVMNLVINGAEAIRARSGSVLLSTAVVQVGAERGLPPGEYVCFAVQDSGCGMDEEVRARVFEPFFSTKADGRGLGLAGVLGIVRAHRGAIEVESAPGKGSTFRVLLPV